ncbi:Ig-like domain-containing protein [Clostridium paraputrificum]|uniref:Ig-like domain-containing protein n=1 Tax=Clostridium paraputrificum TaxID=29363 RepID=UPI003D332878
MKRKTYLSVLSVFILTLLAFVFCGANPPNKEILLSSSVKEDMKIQENSILQALDEGNILLQNENFIESKNSYERAISYDKSNIDTYLDIKDKYLKVNRFDDAYYFIKLAIDNNIDRDNMIVLLDNIKSNFETTIINKTININTSYSLPEDVQMLINGEANTVKVQWENTNINTSSLGIFSFNGISDEYGRKVLLNLTVREPIKERKIGFVTNLYEKNGDTYITFDEAQYFIDTETDKQATNEAIKDGLQMPPDGLIYDSYYIRNSSNNTIEYKLSKSAKFGLCSYLVNKNSTGSSIPTTLVDYATFSNHISTGKEYSYQPSRALLFWIDTEDNIVNKLNMQFTP